MSDNEIVLLTDPHLTFRDFPVGTRISWLYQDTGPERDGTIVNWSTDRRHVTIRSNIGNEPPYTAEAADVFVSAVLSPNGAKVRAIRKSHSHPINPTPATHPMGSVMIVKLRVDGQLTLPEKVHVLQYTPSLDIGGDRIWLEHLEQRDDHEGFDDHGTWHNLNDVYVERTVSVPAPNHISHPNPSDHPVGSRIRWVEVSNPEKDPRDSDILAWKDNVLTIRECFTTIDRIIAADQVEIKAVIHVPKPRLAEHLASTFAPTPAIESTFFEAVKKVKELGEQLGYKITISLE